MVAAITGLSEDIADRELTQLPAALNHISGLSPNFLCGREVKEEASEAKEEGTGKSGIFRLS